MKLTVHGVTLSPWVRRLMIFLEEKGLPYELERVMPLGPPDPKYLKISPLGKVPLLTVDGRHLPDSLAACVFLESEVPEPPLFPEDSWDKGWMYWLCDFIGTGLFSKVEVPLFLNRFVNPVFLNQKPDADAVAAALKAMPYHYDYLEAQLSQRSPWLLGEQLTLADLTAGSVFINLRHAGEEVDAGKWPQLAGYVLRVHQRSSFRKLIELEREKVGEASPMFRSD
ncbi:MAG: glutathione S-transferase family protein [Pseudomonadota bacterium]